MRANPLLPYALCALALAACSKRGEPAGTTTVTGADNPLAEPPEDAMADQAETDADVQVTADVRRAFNEDESLAPIAKNVAISTKHGVVTLHGSVRTEAERAMLVLHARRQPGVARVENQIIVESGALP
jgi:osmotically-inducible protein OsmY